MTKTTLFASILGATAIVLLTCGQADAQSCPTDLTGLDSQISDPGLKNVITKTFDDLIAEAGSLNAAIEDAQTKLADFQAKRAALPTDASEAEKALYDEAIIIGESRVTGLQCRLPS